METSMRVLHIAELATIRVLKEAFAIQQSGTATAIWYKGCAHKGLMGWITFQSTWTDADQLKAKLRAVSGYDIIHVHTTCTNAALVTHVRQAADKASRIIWDMHDWTPEVKPDEYKHAFDSVLVPSQGYSDSLKAIGIESTVVYSMLPRAWFHPITDRLVNAGVLVSGIDSKKGKVWRDYTEAQEKLQAELYVYGAISLSVDGPHPLHAEYDNLMLTAPYMGLMKQLSKYAFGYAGAGNSRHTIHDCVTNKFWEYIAAGLPVITFNSDEMSAIVKDQWSGIALDALDQPWKTPPRKHLAEERFRFTMETQLSKIMQAYKEATK